jgi:hypothetical protein
MHNQKLNIGGLQVEARNMGETQPTYAVQVGITDRWVVTGAPGLRTALDFFMEKLFYGLCDGLKVEPQDVSFFVTVRWDDPSAEDDDYDFFLVSFVDDDGLQERLEVTLDGAISRGPLTLDALFAEHERLNAAPQA